MKLFVYGSLLRGFHNNKLLENSKFISNAETIDKYYMVGRLNVELDPFEEGRVPYPPRKLLFPYVFCEYLRKDIIANTIKGEVYEISEQTLSELDIHEGHPYIYRRYTIPVKLVGNLELEANVYMLESTSIKFEIINNPQLLININGDWSTATI